jgi:hypothetical protein
MTDRITDLRRGPDGLFESPARAVCGKPRESRREGRDAGATPRQYRRDIGGMTVAMTVAIRRALARSLRCRTEPGFAAPRAW